MYDWFIRWSDKLLYWMEHRDESPWEKAIVVILVIIALIVFVRAMSAPFDAADCGDALARWAC